MEFVGPSTTSASTSVSSNSSDSPRAYDQQLLSICRVDVPLMKVIPKREVSMFARIWGGLLSTALDLKNPDSWFDFFSFPKCILWNVERGGRRITKTRTKADVVHDRLVRWRRKACGKLFLHVTVSIRIATRKGCREKGLG